jgi:hypothetical protein
MAWCSVAVRPRSHRGRGRPFCAVVGSQRSSFVRPESHRGGPRAGPRGGHGCPDERARTRGRESYAVGVRRCARRRAALALRHTSSRETRSASRLPREPFKVVANLPFGAGTAILRRLSTRASRSSRGRDRWSGGWRHEAGRGSGRAPPLGAFTGSWFELSVLSAGLPGCVFAPPPGPLLSGSGDGASGERSRSCRCGCHAPTPGSSRAATGGRPRAVRAVAAAEAARGVSRLRPPSGVA